MMKFWLVSIWLLLGCASATAPAALQRQAGLVFVQQHYAQVDLMRVQGLVQKIAQTQGVEVSLTDAYPRPYTVVFSLVESQTLTYEFRLTPHWLIYHRGVDGRNVIIYDRISEVMLRGQHGQQTMLTLQYVNLAFRDVLKWLRTHQRKPNANLSQPDFGRAYDLFSEQGGFSVPGRWGK